MQTPKSDVKRQVEARQGGTQTELGHFGKSAETVGSVRASGGPARPTLHHNTTTGKGGAYRREFDAASQAENREILDAICFLL